MTWQFNWVTDWDEIWSEAFAAQWDEWMKVSPTAHVFFHPTLVRAWIDTYMPLRRIEPRFLVAKHEGCTVFLPMVLWRKNWKNGFQRVLIPVGYSDYDYHDPIIAGSTDRFSWCDFWANFWTRGLNGIARDFDVVHLTGIREAVSDSKYFRETKDRCPSCDLSNFIDGEAFLSSVGRNLRKSLTRQERRLAEMGEIDYRVFSKVDLPEAIVSLEEFLLVHTEKCPHAYKAPRFHSNLMQFGLPAGIVHFSTLNVGGHVAAWHLGFVDSVRFYAYTQAYKPEYALVSPGQILLYYCVQDAIRRKLQVFDYLRGDESYKAGWTNHADRLYSFRIASNSFGAGLRNLVADRLKPALSRLL